MPMSKFRRLTGLILALAVMLEITGAVLPEADTSGLDGMTETAGITDVAGDTETAEDTETPVNTDVTETEETGVVAGEAAADEITETAEYTESAETPVDTESAGAAENAADNENNNTNNTSLLYEADSYTVTAVYGPETGIPSNCVLVVNEISDGDTYDEYMDLTVEALNEAEINRVRFFDITLMKDGIEYEPAEGTSVSVTITLKESLENEVSVVHINDDAEATVIHDLDVICDDDGEGTEVSFTADGFSAYAIVEGPASVGLDPKWCRIESRDMIAGHIDGIYIGNPEGFYLTNQKYDVNSSRTGIKKTKPASSNPPDDAALYVFEPTGTAYQYRLYTQVRTTKYYIKQSTNSLDFVTDPGQATAFTFSDFPGYEKTLRAVGTGGYYINQQGNAGGNGFAAWNNATDVNARLWLWYYDSNATSLVDPYDLDGVTTGLIYYGNGVAGRGLMTDSSSLNALDALLMPVLSKKDAHSDKLFVPNDTDLTMWTFSWHEDDRYYLTAVKDGTTYYLDIDSGGVSITTEPKTVKVIAGTGSYAGKISLASGNRALAYSGDPDLGFNTVAASSSTSYKWLNLVDLSELTSEYVLPYSAKKISVSDDSITDGTRVIIYTRVWDDEQKKYRFYAVDHDGSLYECFEDGDEIQWIDDRINTLLWNITVYYNEDTEPIRENENYYYELYNEYSEKYIKPNAASEEALADSIIGINLNGRREGKYYSPIIAWDDENYSYAGIRTEKVDPTHLKIVSYPFSEDVPSDESTDFYFAIIQDSTYEDRLHEVKTIDNDLYGITMKIIDFDGGANANSWRQAEQCKFLGGAIGTAGSDPTTGLLSNSLGPDGYPTVTGGETPGASLKVLYDESRLREVNHLFIESTYNTSGYFVYDSTQNFASLKADNNFVVYQEIGTVDGTANKNSMKHGQFMPFNDIEVGSYATYYPYNLYTALQEELPDSNPRKYENLHLVKNPDYQFGVELSTSFVQTPNGRDDWGHDIIYEFTGDDDFWLYVDGELVIDLGGVHSALYGSINYATGEVKIQEKGSTSAPKPGDIVTYNMYDIFRANYIARNGETGVQEYLDGIFTLNSDGQHVFKDYTPHEMKIFYMERGAGASNINMRFNQSSVKPETVILSKDLTGVDNVEKFNAEFPYQIYYRYSEDSLFYTLTNTDANINVYYRSTNKEVKYKQSYTIDGEIYDNVFFLKPGEACEIHLPDNIIEYYIVECGVDPYVYSHVYANEDPLTGVTPDPSPAGYERKDYATSAASAKDRTSVKFVNEVNPDALRVLTFTKYLWDENGIGAGNELLNDDTPFNFRLYLATEHETTEELTLANMYTYHVKDPDGRYCKWSSEDQKFVPLRADATDYSTLTVQEKRAASFTTSMYGTISKIPAFYTVEVRELLAGTKYRVEERYSEIPDGYSRIHYVVHDDYGDAGRIEYDDTQSTIIKDKNPHVEVHNIRGYGIRIYKEWTDEKYVSARDATYFAVYKDSPAGEVLDTSSIYMLKFKKNTLYWYYDVLDQGLTLRNYHIREVKVEGAVVDSNGKVTSYTSVTPVADGGEITLGGKLKGETDMSPCTYNVIYDKNPAYNGNNMRVETITNKRDGITIYKKDVAGNPLAGARFDLRDDAGTLIGTFESDDDGFVTVAYLRKNTDYTLAETKSPTDSNGYGYVGLKKPLTLRMDDSGVITVTSDPNSPVDADRFTYVQGPDDPSVTVINIRYDFFISKQDKVTHEPVEGVVFALHKQKTVGGVTVVDFQPIPGYESLVTNSRGTIPKIDASLAPGTYELREISTPATHQGLHYYILFTVTQTGDIVLNAVHPEVDVIEEIEDDRVIYTLRIYNNPSTDDLTVAAQVEGNLGDKTLKFPMTITLTDSNGDPYTGTFTTKYDGTETSHTLTAADGGVFRFELAHDEKIAFNGLDEGTVFKVTEDPLGYLCKDYLDGALKGITGTVTGNTKDNSRVLFVNSRSVIIPTGVESSAGICIGILAVTAAGMAVLTVMSGKRRLAESCSESDASNGRTVRRRFVRRPSRRRLKKLKGLLSK